MKNIGNRLLVWGLLLGAIPSLSNCNRQTESEIMDIHSVNTQLSSFYISNTQLPDLAKISFSVRNSEVGEVFNKEKIAYGLSLKDIVLHIVPAQTNVRVEVAVGEQGSFETWTSTKKYDLSSQESHTLRIRLTQEDGTSTTQRIYRVTLNQHQFNPQTITWAKETATVPYSQSYATIINGTDQLARSLYTWSVSDGVRSYTLSGNTWTEEAEISGLPELATRPQIAGVGDQVYALASGNVYKRNGDSWGRISIPSVSIKALLGYIPQASSTQGKLALIVEQAGIRYFASYDGSKVVVGEVIPTDFPLTNFATQVTGASQYAFSSLILSGGTSDTNSSLRKVWITTNGEDWMHTATLENEISLSSSMAQVGTALYLQEVISSDSTPRVVFYKSIDSGRSWTKQMDIATTDLTHSGFAYLSLIYGTSETNTIYLLGDVIASGETSSLWKGTLKYND